MLRVSLTSIGLYKYKKLSMSVQNKTIINKTIFKPKTRDDHLNQINSTDQFDVLIIGGGATGVGTLLNCSRKGLRTLMIEKNDFGSATSTKSSKLLHGGLRYWQRVFNPFSKTRMEDLYLIQESLEERDIVLNCAPYITGEVGMVLPNKSFLVNLYQYVGVTMYYYYGKLRRSKFINDCQVQIQRPKLISKNDLKQLFPNINKKYNYGVVLYDGQFEESRLLMDSILTSTTIQNEHMQPQNVLNYAELQEFVKDSTGKIIGAQIYDKINKKNFQVKCKTVVNATGIFADKIRTMANESLMNLMVPSKGDHLTFKADGFLNSKSIGLFGADTDDGRVMYVLPWNNQVIVGTTEDKIDKIVSHPHVSETTIPQLMTELKKYFPDQKLELLSQWSGIRPLVKNPDLLNSKELSRKHVIEHDQQSGLISILGGKWTVFRKMGEEVSDKIVNVLKDKQQIKEDQYKVMLEKKTDRIKLLGDKNLSIFTDDKQYHQISKQNMDLMYNEFNMIDQNIVNRLFGLYGLRALMILKELQENEIQRQLICEKNYITKGEIQHIIQTELVEYPVDLLIRRLRIAFEDSNLSKQLLPYIIDIYGDIKNWSTEKRKVEYENNLHILESMKFLQLIQQYGSNKQQLQRVYKLN